MYPLEEKFYSVALRAKQGEFRACSELDDECKVRLLPCFIVPPLSSKKDNALTVDEMTEAVVRSISVHWRSRPCILDLRFMSSDAGRDLDATRIDNLLARMRAARCQVIPMVDLTTDFHRVAAASTHITSTNSGAAIRLTLKDLNISELKQLLDTQLANLNVPSNDCLVILDFSEADLSNPSDFAEFARHWLFQLRSFGPWYKIIMQATSYPRSNPAGLHGTHDVGRNEWYIWERLLVLDASIKEFTMFGDFGADHGKIDFDGGGAPIPHLRYATSLNWKVFRGGAKRETITSVTKRIVESEAFLGEFFSAGDEYISNRSRGVGPVGTATDWRSVNMNHHMTLTCMQLSQLYRVSVPTQERRRKPVQEELL